MAGKIILFDLPSRGRPSCWSLNPWKARLALNFKGLPYTTEWTEYPALAPKFKSLNIPPNPPDINPLAEYSSPAIRLPDGRHVMDSLAIAHELEKLQPQPSLRLDSPSLKRTQEAVATTWKALSPIAIPRVPEMLLTAESAEYFNETRAKRFGRTLVEIAATVDVEEAWKAAEPGLSLLREVLREDEAGPYVLGKETSFADFVIVGMWHLARRIDEMGDLFGRGMAFDQRFRTHYEACAEWLEKDD